MGQTACGAVRCGLQHPVAAAHEYQEGGDLLEQALFAPAKVAAFDVAQLDEQPQTRSKQSGLGLKNE